MTVYNLPLKLVTSIGFGTLGGQHRIYECEVPESIKTIRSISANWYGESYLDQWGFLVAQGRLSHALFGAWLPSINPLPGETFADKTDYLTIAGTVHNKWYYVCPVALRIEVSAGMKLRFVANFVGIQGSYQEAYEPMMTIISDDGDAIR